MIWLGRPFFSSMGLQLLMLANLPVSSAAAACLSVHPPEDDNFLEPSLNGSRGRTPSCCRAMVAGDHTVPWNCSNASGLGNETFWYHFQPQKSHFTVEHGCFGGTLFCMSFTCAVWLGKPQKRKRRSAKLRRRTVRRVALPCRRINPCRWTSQMRLVHPRLVCRIRSSRLRARRLSFWLDARGFASSGSRGSPRGLYTIQCPVDSHPSNGLFPSGRQFTDLEKDFLQSDLLEGGAAGSNATRRKKRQQEDASNFRKLIHGLKGCLNQGQTSWADLTNLLSSVALTDKSKKPKPKKSANKNNPGSQVLQWKDSSGKSWLYTVDEKTGWWSWVSSSSSNKRTAPSGQPPQNGSGPSNKPDNQNPGSSGSSQKHSSWISQVRTLDWATQVPPKLTSLGKLKHKLQNGKDISGNLVEIWTDDHLQELKTLWQVFNQPGPLTAVLCGPAKKTQGAFLTRASLVRQGANPMLEEIALIQIQHPSGPLEPPNSERSSKRRSSAPKNHSSDFGSQLSTSFLG